MKAFVSWSSGKDCMYALYKFLQNKENEVVCLLNMTDADNDYSRSHGIKNEIIQRQAAQLNFLLMQHPTSRASYEIELKKAIEVLKNEGIDAGIFGDIYLKEHRVWIERVCGEMQIKAVFPLWGNDTDSLIRDFVNDGFKSVIVAVRNNILDKSYLGRIIDNNFLDELSKQKNIDLCAENGEYHSFVIDGPLFQQPVNYTTGKIRKDGKNSYIDIL